MKLSEIRSDYVRYSTKLSDINRQLIFAGIAIVWLFRISTTDGITIPQDLLYPLLLFVASFLFDLIQYLVQSVIWYIYYWIKKSSNVSEDDIVAESELWNIPTWAFWLLKVLTLILGYYKLGEYLLNSLFPGGGCSSIGQFLKAIF